MARCPGSRWTVLLAVTALSTSCSGSAAPTTTEPPTTSSSSTTTSIPPTTVVHSGDLWLPPDVCASCSDTVVASTPVGPDGVSYVLEPQPWGPAALAVSPTGGLFVLDALGQGVVRVEGADMTRISLADLGLYLLRVLALLDGDLWVLGVAGGPTEIVRAVQVSSRGEMELGIDFPADLHLDVTVADLTAGPNGELWVDGAWAAGGSKVAVLQTSPPRLELSWGFPYPNGLGSRQYQTRRPTGDPAADTRRPKTSIPRVDWLRSSVQTNRYSWPVLIHTAADSPSAGRALGQLIPKSAPAETPPPTPAARRCRATESRPPAARPAGTPGTRGGAIPHHRRLSFVASGGGR